MFGAQDNKSKLQSKHPLSGIQHPASSIQHLSSSIQKIFCKKKHRQNADAFPVFILWL